MIERLDREIRRRARVMRCSLLLACARLCHVADTPWGKKKYMNTKHLEGDSDGVTIVD